MSEITKAVAAKQTQITQLQSDIETPATCGQRLGWGDHRQGHPLAHEHPGSAQRQAKAEAVCQGRNKIRPDGGGKPDHLAAGSCV